MVDSDGPPICCDVYWFFHGWSHLRKGCWSLYMQYDLLHTGGHLQQQRCYTHEEYQDLEQKQMARVFTYTGCPTRYRTRHVFNNFTTNEDIATKFEADYRYTLETHTTDTHYRHTLQTHTTDTHYRHTLQTHTLQTHITDTHYRHALQTHTTDTHYRHTLQTHTTDTHYRHALQTHTTDTHYRHTLQTHTTDTHYRHTLQTHSSSFLTHRTYCCSNFVAISSLVLESLKKPNYTKLHQIHQITPNSLNYTKFTKLHRIH